MCGIQRFLPPTCGTNGEPATYRNGRQSLCGLMLPNAAPRQTLIDKHQHCKHPDMNRWLMRPGGYSPVGLHLRRLFPHPAPQRHKGVRGETRKILFAPVATSISPKPVTRQIFVNHGNELKELCNKCHRSYAKSGQTLPL